jgi:hypothetical protein
MLSRYLFLSLLLATPACVADDLPTPEDLRPDANPLDPDAALFELDAGVDAGSEVADAAPSPDAWAYPTGVVLTMRHPGTGTISTCNLHHQHRVWVVIDSLGIEEEMTCMSSNGKRSVYVEASGSLTVKFIARDSVTNQLVSMTPNQFAVNWGAGVTYQYEATW